MDRRLTPANGRVAHLSLRGQVEAARFTEGRPARLAVPVADLLARPGGARDRQVLFGAPLLVLEEAEGVAFVQSLRDGYVGYLPLATLTTAAEATHWVAAPATHVYSRADLKSAEIMGLSFGSQLTVTGQEGRFLALDTGGFVPVQHLREIGALFTDPVAVAARFIGTPYLWGGNSRQGIDCSGLVQMACHACGFDCPGDSDMQAAGFGRLLGAEEELRRGDLLFWKGHVAFVAGPDLILHANGNDMAVAEEGMAAAIARIAAAGEGPVTARRRFLG
ncbi:NlpC/P60 family protein [Thioclava sp. BHET1]|nr:NlpC/P60 family protein [Thioclava sp. BHET1]